MKRWLLLGIVALTACESDVQKLGRLRREKELAYGRMIVAQENGHPDSIQVTEQRLREIEQELNTLLARK